MAPNVQVPAWSGGGGKWASLPRFSTHPHSVSVPIPHSLTHSLIHSLLSFSLIHSLAFSFTLSPSLSSSYLSLPLSLPSPSPLPPLSLSLPPLLPLPLPLPLPRSLARSLSRCSTFFSQYLIPFLSLTSLIFPPSLSFYLSSPSLSSISTCVPPSLFLWQFFFALLRRSLGLERCFTRACTIDDYTPNRLPVCGS